MPYFIHNPMEQMKKHIISIRKLTAPAIFFSLVFLYLTPCYAKKVTLSWNASPGATGYKIYYKTGNPGPPYKGTGATKNNSAKVISSPIVIGASTQTTINLPNGKYRLALTAYNKYGESEYSGEVSANLNPSGTASPDTDYSTCKIQKVSAAKNLCTSLFSGYSKVIKAPDEYHLDSLVRSAEAEFESSWEEADDCPTASMEYIGDIIFLAVEDMARQISDGVNLESRGGRALGDNLLEEVQKRCVRSFKNKKNGTFRERWNWYITGFWQWGIGYSGPPRRDIQDIIDAMVTDVLAEIL
jgi:hypothetical protein